MSPGDSIHDKSSLDLLMVALMQIRSISLDVCWDRQTLKNLERQLISCCDNNINGLDSIDDVLNEIERILAEEVWPMMPTLRFQYCIKLLQGQIINRTRQLKDATRCHS